MTDRSVFVIPAGKAGFKKAYHAYRRLNWDTERVLEESGAYDRDLEDGTSEFETAFNEWMWDVHEKLRQACPPPVRAALACAIKGRAYGADSLEYLAQCDTTVRFGILRRRAMRRKSK